MDDVITTQNPSTMLKMHEDAVVVIDRELARRRGLQSLTPTAEKRRCSGRRRETGAGRCVFHQQKNRPAAAAFAARKRVASYSLRQYLVPPLLRPVAKAHSRLTFISIPDKVKVINVQ